MSVTPYLLEHPVYTVFNVAAIPVTTDEDVTLAIFQFVFPIHLVLDTVKEQLFKGRSLGEEQAGVYYGLAEKLKKEYGLDGRACVQRFVCELQRRHISGWSVAGRILTHLFTPHTGGNKRNIDLLRDYLTAQSLGNKEDNVCGLHYQSCPFSVFNFFDARKNITKQP